MIRRLHLWKTFVYLAIVSTGAFVHAQSAGTSVDVGRWHAGANASATGAWQLTDTESRVGSSNMGRALAVGAGPGGVSLAHSIGVNGGGTGVGHNFNLSVGPSGSHVSHGGVVTQGGNSRVTAGGQTQSSNYGPTGGSTVSGWGNRTQAYSRSQTTRHSYPLVRRSRWVP